MDCQGPGIANIGHMINQLQVINKLSPYITAAPQFHADKGAVSLGQIFICQGFFCPGKQLWIDNRGDSLMLRQITGQL